MIEECRTYLLFSKTKSKGHEQYAFVVDMVVKEILLGDGERRLVLDKFYIR